MWHTHPGYTTGAGDPILCRIHILYLFYEFYWTVEHLCLVVWQVQIGCHSETCPCQAHMVGSLHYLLGCIFVFI